MRMSSLAPPNRHATMPLSSSTLSVSPALRPTCFCPALPSSSSRIASSSSSGAGGNSSGDYHALGGSSSSWLPAAHSSSTSAAAAARRQHVVPRAGFGGFGAKAGKPGGSKSKDCPCGSGKLYTVRVVMSGHIAGPTSPVQAAAGPVCARQVSTKRADDRQTRGSTDTLLLPRAPLCCPVLVPACPLLRSAVRCSTRAQQHTPTLRACCAPATARLSRGCQSSCEQPATLTTPLSR